MKPNRDRESPASHGKSRIDQASFKGQKQVKEDPLHHFNMSSSKAVDSKGKLFFNDRQENTAVIYEDDAVIRKPWTYGNYTDFASITYILTEFCQWISEQQSSTIGRTNIAKQEDEIQEYLAEMKQYLHKMNKPRHAVVKERYDRILSSLLEIVGDVLQQVDEIQARQRPNGKFCSLKKTDKFLLTIRQKIEKMENEFYFGRRNIIPRYVLEGREHLVSRIDLMEDPEEVVVCGKDNVSEVSLGEGPGYVAARGKDKVSGECLVEDPGVGAACGQEEVMERHIKECPGVTAMSRDNKVMDRCFVKDPDDCSKYGEDEKRSEECPGEDPEDCAKCGREEERSEGCLVEDVEDCSKCGEDEERSDGCPGEDLEDCSKCGEDEERSDGCPGEDLEDCAECIGEEERSEGCPGEDPGDGTVCGEEYEVCFGVAPVYAGACGEDEVMEEYLAECLADDAVSGEDEDVTGRCPEMVTGDDPAYREGEVSELYLNEVSVEAKACVEEVTVGFVDTYMEDVVACGQDEEVRCLQTGIGDIKLLCFHNEDRMKTKQMMSMSDITKAKVVTKMNTKHYQKVDDSEHDQSLDAHEDRSAKLNWKKRKKMEKKKTVIVTK